MKRREFLTVSGAVVASMALPARAAYPEKPVHYILAFAPGGESDIAARLQQLVWCRKWGQELVVESKPDHGDHLPHLVLQPLEGNVQYQTDDIVNVYFFNYTPDAIVVRNESPFKTYQDFIAAAKAKPGTLNLARLAVLAPRRPRGRRDVVLVARRGAEGQDAHPRRRDSATPLLFPGHADLPRARHRLGRRRLSRSGCARSMPEDLRRRISEMLAEINRDADFCRAMTEQGLEIVDVPYEKMPAFIDERKKAYLSVAKLMGLTK